MKRLAVLSGLATVLVFGALAASTRTEGAVIINDGGCALVDQNGTATISADSDHAVINRSNSHLMCKVSDVANPTGKAVHWDFANTGLVCRVYGPGGNSVTTTEDWHQTTSASGQATLICKLPL